MVMKLKQMCQPAQVIVLFSVASMVFEILRTRMDLFNIHNLFVIMTLVVSHLTVAVMADIFCQSGYENFAWLIILLSFLMFVGADRMLEKSVNTLFPTRR